jgi:hypothetical protein
MAARPIEFPHQFEGKFAGFPNDWRKHVLKFFCVWIPRKLYKWLHVPVPRVDGHWDEHNGTVLTEAEADELLKKLPGEGWYAQPSPIGKCLPARPCKYGQFLFKDEGVTRDYENVEFDYGSIPWDILTVFDKQLDSVNRSMKT